MDDIYKINDIQTRLAPVFSANGVKSAVLYGSYAKGSANPKSDVDLLVDSGLCGLDFVGLIEIIREALDKEVDVIDVRYVKKDSPVANEILQTGVRIYG
ncbi:MAG: nucleotidyltransferase domain-containing protein [Oscillospiraceae bacterium]|nr:nucleotidyltransferase domain-containing protein [Oscillospiraceae bacterium]